MGETLKEFLVALGFDVDENSYSKFQTRVGRATAGAAELGTQVVATAIAVETAVAKMARNFEELFYASQRTQSSIRALQGFSYGAKTVGVDADRARGAVEGLARAMRSNPGIGALINQLGVRTQGRGSVEIMNDLVGQLKKMPFYLAQQYGNTLGIDGDTLKMLIDRYDEFQKAQKDYQKRQKDAGVDADKLGEKSRTLVNALRALETTLGLIGDRILQNFVEPVTKAVHWLDEGAQKIIAIDKATNGWATTLGTIATTALGVWISKILLMKTVFRSALAAGAGVGAAGAGGAAAGGAGAGASAATAAGGAAAASGLARVSRGGVTGAALTTLGIMNEDDLTGGRVKMWLRRKLGISSATTADRDKAVAYFISQGWTREQAVGLVTNLDRESALNPEAIGDKGKAYGLAQWHKDRQENFKKLFGKDIRQSTFEEQLQFMQHELTQGAEKFAGAMIRRSGSASEAAAAVSKYYERPRDTDREMRERGAQAKNWYDAGIGTTASGGDKNVTVNSKTDIHVKSTDPKSAAREVFNGQDDAAARAARYAGQATR